MRDLSGPLQSIRRIDFLTVIAIALLLVAGAAFIFSASHRSDAAALNRMTELQIGWIVVGIAIFFAVLLMDYERFGEVSWGLYAGTLVLLVLVLLVGKKVYGAYRWLNLFGINVQPSEFAKLAVLLVLARFLSEPGRPMDSWKTVFHVFIIVGIPSIFILKQPDLGTTMTMVPLTAVMLFAAGVPLRYLLIIAGVALLAAPAGWFVLSDYQQERILVFLDPDRDPLDAGWNLRQSLIAVGSGMLTGKGYLMGTQNVLGFLPRTVAPTDFIFSVIAEETGFVGSLVLLSLFAAVLWGGVRTALVARDKMGRLLAVGVVTLLFSHVFVNVAMTVGLMPITGIPLPLISYGGSFMICMMAALGLVQSVYVRRPRRG